MTTRPLVTFFDPHSWSRDFSYEVEREALAARGVDLRVPNDVTERDELIERADVVISCGTTLVTAADIDRMANCIGIQCYSVGMDKVDHDRAAERRIAITNVNASTADVADHTLALVLAMQRQLPAMSRAAAARYWHIPSQPEWQLVRRPTNQVLGVVGVGRIGRQVVQRAQAFGFTTIGTDPIEPAPPIEGLDMVSFDELLGRSDVIALCASLSTDSIKLFDADAFNRMKPGVQFVNTARGKFVDEDALADALNAGQVGFAALDVRFAEPPDPATDRLTGHPRVIQTPHMGALSDQSRIDIHHLVAESVLELLADADRLNGTNQ